MLCSSLALKENMDFEIAKLSELSSRYSGSLPRYTSYPTAVELKETAEDSLVRELLACCGHSGKAFSLYVHLPHCPSLCYFCACNKIITLKPEQRLRYLGYLRRECELIRQAAGCRLPLAEVHLGGGSPSFLSKEEAKMLLQFLQEHFSISADCELSLEVDPRTFNESKAEVYFTHGFRRASIGVQDFDPRVQWVVNRKQSFALTERIVQHLRAIGFKSINVDLIYGLPEQTPDSFDATLQLVGALRPERIALYGYAHVSWKSKVQNAFKRYRLPNSNERLQLFKRGVEVFTALGYRYLGLDHFALPGDDLCRALQSGSLRRNFMGYTTIGGEGVLAAGCSSISDVYGTMYQNYSAMREYERALDAGRLPLWRALKRSEHDLIRAYIIERIMCDTQVSLESVAKNFSCAELIDHVWQEALPELRRFAADGLVLIEAGTLTITQLGRYFLRHIASSFDVYLPQHLRGTHAKFSQAV